MSESFDYGGLAQRVIEAQAAFRQIYEKTNPAPLPPSGRAKRDWLGRAALLLVMVGAVIVSGSHTVAVFSIGKSGGIGAAAFVMLELGLFIFSFIYTRDTYRSRDDVQVLGYLKRGMQVTFMVLIFGNVSDVLQANGFASGSLWTVITFVVSMGVALSAPVVAYIVGHTLAMLLVQDNALDRKAREDYEKSKAVWIEEFMRVWNANKFKWGATVSVDVPKVSNGIPMENTMENQAVIAAKSSIGHSKVPDASKRVNDFFDTYPDALERNAIDVAHELGVGKSTVYSIMKERKQVQVGGDG